MDPSPKLRPYPTNQKENPPISTSMAFFIMMLASFLRDPQPDSSRANPVCMERTMKTALNIQEASSCCQTLTYLSTALGKLTLPGSSSPAREKYVPGSS